MSFPKYPAYRESGVEWLGLVPVGWEVVPIKSVSSCNDEVLGENTPPETEIDYVEISDVDAARGIVASTSTIFAEAPSRARRIVRAGDVLVSTVRTYLRAIAPVDATSANMIVSTGFAVIRPRIIHPGFLGYLFRSEFLIGEVIASSTGVSYPAISANELMRLRFAMPSLEEQAGIAAFLDRETAKIDGLIGEQQQLVELLREKRQAVISHAVTKGLDPSVPMKDSGVEWLGLVPAHWEVKRLKRIATVQGGVAKGKDLAGQRTVTVPYLRVANVQDGYLKLETIATMEIPEGELDRYLLQPGDVLMNEGGDFDKLGRGYIWRGEIDPCSHQNHVFAVRPKSVGSEWLNAVTGSDYAQFYFMTRSKQSTNLASISSTNLMELPVVLPPVGEQNEILRFIEVQKVQFDALTAEAETAIRLLRERRTALISAAVTGKIDVRGIVAG